MSKLGYKSLTYTASIIRIDILSVPFTRCRNRRRRGIVNKG